GGSRFGGDVRRKHGGCGVLPAPGIPLASAGLRSAEPRRQRAAREARISGVLGRPLGPGLVRTAAADERDGSGVGAPGEAGSLAPAGADSASGRQACRFTLALRAAGVWHAKTSAAHPFGHWCLI